MTEPLREGDLLTIAQALRLVPVGKSTLYALVESGQLPCVRVSGTGARSGRILLWREDLEAFVERARHRATRAPVRPDVAAILGRAAGDRDG